MPLENELADVQRHAIICYSQLLCFVFFRPQASYHYAPVVRRPLPAAHNAARIPVHVDDVHDQKGRLVLAQLNIVFAEKHALQRHRNHSFEAQIHTSRDHLRLGFIKGFVLFQTADPTVCRIHTCAEVIHRLRDDAHHIWGDVESVARLAVSCYQREHRISHVGDILRHQIHSVEHFVKRSAQTLIRSVHRCETHLAFVILSQSKRCQPLRLFDR